MRPSFGRLQQRPSGRGTRQRVPLEQLLPDRGPSGVGADWSV